MVDTLHFQVDRDEEIPEELRDELAAVGVKYRRFREVSRETVHEVKEAAEYFVRWLSRVSEEARGDSQHKMVAIGRIFEKLASKLEPVQAKLGECVQAYSAAQEDVEALAERAKGLQEQSDFRANALLALTVGAAIVAPAALLVEQGLLSLAAGSAGIAGKSLNADYTNLGRFYAQFCTKMQAVANRVRAEGADLNGVRLALRTASSELFGLEEELSDGALGLLADAAEDASEAFGKLAKRCDAFLSSSVYDPSARRPKGLLGR